MMKCIIVDDEPLALAQLQSYVSRVSFLECVAACSSAVEASTALSDGEVDVMFVDINMPDVNGLQLVHSLDNPPKIVFTTAYSEYALDGFKANAVDYLLKPFGFDEFLKAANKVYKLYMLEQATCENKARGCDDGEEALFVKSDYRILRVPVRSIRYIEGMSEYVRIYVDGESRPVISLLSMKKIEECLPSNLFMRVHRSYIVNLCKIKEVSRMRIVYDGNVCVPIGDMYKEKFMEYVDRYFVGRK